MSLTQIESAVLAEPALAVVTISRGAEPQPRRPSRERHPADRAGRQCAATVRAADQQLAQHGSPQPFAARTEHPDLARRAAAHRTQFKWNSATAA